MSEEKTYPYHKVNLNIDPAIGKAFRDYVYKSKGSTYYSGKVLEEFIIECLARRGEPTGEPENVA